MQQFIRNLFPKPNFINNEKFKQKKFSQNNFRIMLISSFLIMEQIFYALFVSNQDHVLQKIYFCTAVMMLIYIISSIYLYYNKPGHILWMHIIYESSLGIFGILIAIFRIIIVKQQLYGLPTIYIAVIYGVAFIFYYSYKQSFFIYFFSALFLICFLTFYKPSLQFNNYMADIISNNLIAWIASMANYRKYRKEFYNMETIEEKNQKLIQKNKEIKEINNMLHEISITDQLTGIYNRRKIEKILNEVYAEANRYNKIFSIILLDLDNFKDINDNFGHPLGDKILIKISKSLTENIRTPDTCGRWGGEEFLIVCPETNLNSAYNLALRLKKIIENTDFPKVKTVTGSFGIASYQEGNKIKDLIKIADKSLYQAKKMGRNRVESILI